jgi:osmotically-inducible protein OsmY
MKNGLNLGVRLLWIAAAIWGSSLLQGCVPLMLGSAAVKGVSMVRDRRTVGEQVEDQTIEIKAATQLASQFGSTANISTKAYDGKVLLTGDAFSEKIKQQAAETVRKIENVKSVVDQVRVGPLPSLGDISQDTWLSTAVFGAMTAAQDVPSRTIVTAVSHSEVYLMGKVTTQEGDRTAAAASKVSGVKSVNKLFEIITPQQAAKLDDLSLVTPSPSSSNPATGGPTTGSPSSNTTSGATDATSGGAVQVMPIQ